MNFWKKKTKVAKEGVVAEMKFLIAGYCYNDTLDHRSVASLLVNCAHKERRSMADVLGQFIIEHRNAPPPEFVTARDIFNIAEAVHQTAPIFGMGMALVYRALDLTPETFIALLRESRFRLDSPMDRVHFFIAEDSLGLPRLTLSELW